MGHERSSPAPIIEPAREVQPDLPIGESSVFRQMMDKVRRYAPFDDMPVVFEGETGTGKTILARFLHSLSPRARKPFEPIDLGTLEDGVAASELLGHARGAFTGAIADARGPFTSAHGGTVFLDELENASAAVQRCLLRVTGEGELRPVGASRSMRLDVRLITATNVPIGELVTARRLLPDLAARLCGCPIRIPPLREHASDIPLLVRHFVRSYMAKLGYERAPAVDPALMAALVRNEWPENVRGLSRVVYRLLIEAAPATTITIQHCRDDLGELVGRRARDGRRTADEAHEALRACGSATEAARRLGVSRATFYRLLKGAESPGGHATSASEPRLTDVDETSVRRAMEG